MTVRPTIIIGIGSSGLYVLEQLQNFCYENTGKNKLPGVEYLYIETNKDNVPNLTALPNEIQRVYVSLAEMATMVRELKEKKHVTNAWLPPEEHILDAGIGAGGIPSCGRLALWGRNNEGDNLSKVINAIMSARAKVGNISVEAKDNAQPTVFITGSLTGGTGTGIFLDIAYLMRHLVHDIKELFGLLLLPPKPVSFAGNEIIYANTYGALTALQHFNDPDHGFKVTLPNEYTLDYKNPPFELAQLISQSYNSNLSDIHSLSGLYRVAGLYLFLNVIGLRRKRLERLVDARGNWQIGKYSTFGISAIQYPKSQIKEYISLEFGTELLNKWTDARNYYIGGQNTPINPGTISNRIKEVFTGFLKTALDTLNNTGRNIPLEIKMEAAKVNKGDHTGNKAQYLAQQFSSDKSGNWYETVQNNVSIAQDSMIRNIANFIVAEFNRYENLYFVRTELLAFAEAIEDCVKYWKTLSISAQKPEWENFLHNKQVPWMLKKRFGFLLEQDNVLEDRMTSTLDLMKFHLFGRSLVNIRQHILKEDLPMVTASVTDRVELPSIPKLDSIIKDIQIVLGTVEEPQKRFKSLDRRKGEIKADMDDTTVPILRIFPSGKFQTEVEQSIKRYKQQTGQALPQKEHLIGGQNLWDYLTNKETRLINRLYHDCILRFAERLEQVQCVEDYDVARFIERNPSEAVKIAERAGFYLLPIHQKTLEDNRNIPRMVIGSDINVVQKVIKKLNDENFFDFTDSPDHMLQIEELKNIMVFYVEKGNFEPPQDITYMEVVKRLYAEYPERQGGKLKQYWHNFRNPYLNQDNAKT